MYMVPSFLRAIPLQARGRDAAMQHMHASSTDRCRAVRPLAGSALLLAVVWSTPLPAQAQPKEAAAAQAVYSQSTYSSPIALSADGRLVWSVNPGDDSVSVLRTDTNTVLAKIRVGDEPQSVALDPSN